MNHDLFEYENVEFDADGNLFYEGVTLLQPIGAFIVGHKFDVAEINVNGTEETDFFPQLQLINYRDTQNGRQPLYEGTYSLSFRVLNVVDEPQ